MREKERGRESKKMKSDGEEKDKQIQKKIEE